MTIIEDLKGVEIFLINNMWTIRLYATFLQIQDFPDLSKEVTFEDTWTYISKFSLNKYSSEKEFLYQLVFENTIIDAITNFEATLKQVLDLCECLNQDEVQSLLLLEQIDKL